MSETGRLLSKMLDHPDEWVNDSANDRKVFVIKHVPTETAWWVANGAWFFEGHRAEDPKLGLIERHFLWRKAVRLVRAMSEDKSRLPLTRMRRYCCGSENGVSA